MKTFFAWLLRGLLIGLVMVAGLLFLERDRVTRLLAVNSLFAEDKIVGNFTAMDSMFEHIALTPEIQTVNRLTKGADLTMPSGFTAWTQDRAVTGIIVVKDGVIRHESYPLVADAETDPAMSTRISWSVAKSFLSVLMGVLVEDGTIPDLDAQVTQYAPSLSGSAYDGATCCKCHRV